MACLSYVSKKKKKKKKVKESTKLPYQEISPNMQKD